jgi:flagellar biosynthetic protein FliR
MTVSAEVLAGLATAWLWPFFRIAALVAVAPLFGGASVPPRVRLSVALGLALVLAPLVPAPPVDPLSTAGVLLVAEQVVIGLALGLAIRLSLTVFDLAGQVIGQTMGLGFASMVDPATGTQVPVVSQIYLVLVTLVLVSINGHLLIMRVLASSFEALPPGQVLGAVAFGKLAAQATWVFAAGVLVALPAVTAMLVVNLAFGVMTRAAPQLNVFAVGFPITLLMGFSVIFLTLPGVLGEVESVLTEVLTLAVDLMGAEG